MYYLYYVVVVRKIAELHQQQQKLPITQLKTDHINVEICMYKHRKVNCTLKFDDSIHQRCRFVVHVTKLCTR